MDWPSPGEQLERTEEALIVVTRLLRGETVDFDGRYFKAKNGVLYSLPRRRVPVYLSAFHDGAAELAGRLVDGIWTLADPLQAPRIIAAAANRAGRRNASRGRSSCRASSPWRTRTSTRSSRRASGRGRSSTSTSAIRRRSGGGRPAGETEVPDSKFAKQVIPSSDPAQHVKRIKLLEKLGATKMALMNVSADNPHAAIRVYGESVLPELR